jgi:glycerol dehydrogenase
MIYDIDKLVTGEKLVHLMFGAPGRYIQGPDVISQIGGCIAQCGRSGVVVSDSVVVELVREPVSRSCKEANVDVAFLAFDGEVTADGIEKLKASFGSGQAGVVIGAGGGKGIDAGKALAHARNAALITLPTVASNDAPTSKNYVVYDDHHQLVHVGHLPASPRFVIVDTALIARAPRQFLAMGIADGLTKNFEAEQCLKSGGTNLFGARPSLAGVALARECYRLLRADSKEALAAAGTGQPNEAFERVVEAALLMSGLGFESGGLSIAHAMTRGLSRVSGPREAVHGWQVAYGLLLQLVLERRDEAFMSDLLAFYDVVGLPKSLADLKVAQVTDEILHQIAEPSLAAPLARNFERQVSMDEMVAAMKTLETLTVK